MRHRHHTLDLAASSLALLIGCMHSKQATTAEVPAFCISRCNNVKHIAPCQPAARNRTFDSLREVLSAPDTWNGQVVQLRGRLLRAHALWTEINCNRGEASVTIPIAIAGGTVTAMLTPTLTSATDNLKDGSAVTVTGGSFIAVLPSMSVTTFSGK